LSFRESAGLKIKVSKSNESLIFIVDGYSADLVRVSLESLVKVLKLRHEEILVDSQKNLNKELLRSHNESIVLFENLFLALNSESSTKNKFLQYERFVSGVEYFAIQREFDRIFNMFNSYINTRQTVLMEPIVVLERRLFPKLWKPSLIGAFLGIFCIWIFGVLQIQRRSAALNK
jgi:hypothetical protein